MSKKEYIRPSFFGGSVLLSSGGGNNPIHLNSTEPIHYDDDDDFELEGDD